MAIASFDAGKVMSLLQLSVDNPDHRRFNIEQRYSVSMLRDDLPEERRAQIMAQEDDGMSFEIDDADLDPKKVPPGVWLVGDSGVYLMMNVDMGLPLFSEKPVEHAVQCFETDPRNVGREIQYDEKRRIFGGDDGCIFLPEEAVLEMVSRSADANGAKVCLLEITPDSVGIVGKERAEEYVRSVIGPDKDFCSPDTKRPPVLWAGPKKRPETESPESPQ